MYLNVEEIEAAITNLAAAHPGAAEVIDTPFATHEGRVSRLLRIGASPADAVDGILVLGGVHAREWVPPDALVALAADLLEANALGTGLAYGTATFSAAQVQQLVATKNLFLYPCVNPDGRHHSQTTTPAWRKNRRPAPVGESGDNCVGVDLNRNFPIVWDHLAKFAADSGVNTSSNPCGSDVYRGPAAASEPEARNVIAVLDAYPRIRWHIDVHSSSPVILHSWGTDENQTTTPGDNFQNAALDGVRGRPGDGVGEYVSPDDLAIAEALSDRMDGAIVAASGSAYGYEQAYALYPTSGASDDYAFSRTFVDPSLTKTYGFTIECGTSQRPTYSVAQGVMREVGAALLAFGLASSAITDRLRVTLLNSTVFFNDVPEGETTARAVTWEVEATTAVTFTVISGPTGPFDLPLGGSVTVGGSPAGVTTTARLWLTHQGTTDGATATGSIRVRCEETGEEWAVSIAANTVAPPTVGIALVLDRSGSMLWDAGDGRARVDVLREAAGIFVDVVQPPNGVGVVSFDHDSRLDTPVVVAGDETFGSGRAVARAVVASHTPNPVGGTSIGDGVESAVDALDAAVGFDQTAMIVLTDGQQTAPVYVADASGIDGQVFAIGLGRASDIDPATLTQLTDGTGGYVVVTGALDIDERFVLTKYFLQALAGITNEEIVLDPQGHLQPGSEVLVPFHLTHADRTCDVILATPYHPAISFDLITPHGEVLTPGSGGTYVAGRAVAYHRLNLPIPGPTGAWAGQWKARLRIDRAAWKSYVSEIGPAELETVLPDLRHGVPWMLEVHAKSDVRLKASVTQTGTQPGKTLHLEATLHESDLPHHDAKIVAEVTTPNGTITSVALEQDADARYSAELTMHESGLYRARLLARGQTFKGERYAREATRTAAAYRPNPPVNETTGGPTQEQCDRVAAAFGRALGRDPRLAKALNASLVSHGTELEAVVSCLSPGAQVAR